MTTDVEGIGTPDDPRILPTRPGRSEVEHNARINRMRAI